MHKKRLFTLIELVDGLIFNKKLSVTELGRSIRTSASERSSIRRSDRFVGNKKMYDELPDIYKRNIDHIIGAKTAPHIIVDWTHIPNIKCHALRASLVCTGRALTLYEQVHPEKKLGNRKTEKNFLMKLRDFLPKNCKPVIITDAGFHNEWFQTITDNGWDYVGRIRGMKIFYDGESWTECRKWLPEATTKAKYMGNFFLCKKNSIQAKFYLIKEKSGNRKCYKRQKLRGGRDVQNHRRAAKEPWLLVSSLQGKHKIASKVIKIYRKRMQIEEAFRDLKSSKYGFGLRNAYSRDPRRISILLLIAMFSSLIAWLIGYVAEKSGLHYKFQACSIRARRILSYFFLGCQIIRRKIKIKTSTLFDALEYLHLAGESA